MKYIFMLFLAATFTVSNVEAKEEKHKKIVQKHVEEHVELTLKQKQLLTTAYHQAKEDGLINPFVLPGILMVESKAGAGKKFRTARHKPHYDQSVGIAQIIASTARGVLKKHPEVKAKMGNKGLDYELANNDHFNIAIASSYLQDLSEITHSEAQLIAAYNTGRVVKRPERMGYVKKVQSNIVRVKKELL